MLARFALHSVRRLRASRPPHVILATSPPKFERWHYDWRFGGALFTSASAAVASQVVTCRPEDQSAHKELASSEEGRAVKDLASELTTLEVPMQAWPVQRPDGGLSLSVLWKQGHLRSEIDTQFVRVEEVSVDGSFSPAPGGSCWDVGSARAIVPSASGERTAVVRAGEGDAGSLLQLWSSGRLQFEVDIDARVLTDPYFSSFEWDAEEQRLCFIAEPPPTVGPELGPSGAKGKAAWKGCAPYEPDWGELLVGARSPCVFVLDIRTRHVTKIAAPAASSCGHCTWSPNGEDVVFTVWENESSQLPGVTRPGLIYCYNRASALYKARADGEGGVSRVTPASIISASNPTFSPDGKTLAFLSSASAVRSGSHKATDELITLSWADGVPQSQPHVVVPEVQRPNNSDAFPGLYAMRLQTKTWSSNSTLLVNSQWRSDQAIVSVDVTSGTVQRLTPPGSSYSLLALCGELAVAASSSPCKPTQLSVAHLASSAIVQRWSHLSLSPHSPEVESMLASITSETISVTPAGTEEPIDAIIVRPRKEASRALPALFLHGGPHSASSTCWTALVAFLAGRGYSVVVPNYRGSVGFGERALQSLPGNIGTNDVGDCLASLAEARERGLCADPAGAGVSVIGGSHGGFLAGHLAGQRPDIVRAAILRNPVCDISSMVAVSDIPDWCYREAIGDVAAFSLAPSMSVLAKMRACSPAAHASTAASVPHLFLLGNKDVRVPPSQGILHAKLLKEKGAKNVETIMFPADSHPLARTRTSMQTLVLVCDFLGKHHPRRDFNK